MGDQQNAATGNRCEHVADELARGVRIEMGRRLIEDEHRRVREQRTRDDDPLPLSPGQLATALADPRVDAVGEPLDPVPDPRAAQRLRELMWSSAGTPQQHVVADRRREQVRLLAGDGDRPPDVLERVVAEIASGEQHSSFRRIKETQEEVDDRRLARSARTE